MNIILSVVLYLYRTFVCMFITVQRHLLVLPMANWLLLWIIAFTLPNRLFYKKTYITVLISFGTLTNH
jgi:hypothetical protein